MNIEEHFMIIFSICFLIFIITQVLKMKTKYDTESAIIMGINLGVIFVLWILYCLFHLNIL